MLIRNLRFHKIPPGDVCASQGSRSSNSGIHPTQISTILLRSVIARELAVLFEKQPVPLWLFHMTSKSAQSGTECCTH